MGETARTKLIDIYLDYVNDYLSPEVYAEHNGLTKEQAIELLRLAKSVYDSKHPDA